MGIPDAVAAKICGISPGAQRQRLARARQTMRTIIANRCGLIDAANPCRCGRQIESSLAAGILDPHPLFATHPGPTRPGSRSGRSSARRNNSTSPLAMSEIYRSDPSFAAPRELWERVQAACPDLHE